MFGSRRIKALENTVEYLEKRHETLLGKVYAIEGDMGRITEFLGASFELDIAMHGEEGAAKQASLCDLIEPAKRMRKQIAEAKAEIEAMRPVVEGCKARYARHNPRPNPPHPGPRTEYDGLLCYCLTCQWYRDYESRKQP